MAEVEVTEQPAEQSEVLSEGEITDIVEGVEPEEAVLPSDTQEFEIPEKFQGKSLEDVIKSYQELEKLKTIKEEEVVPKATEEKEEAPKDDTEPGEYDKYIQSFEEKGELSEEDYAELEKAGHSKEEVDKVVEEYKERKEFQEYKQDKILNEILEPLGGGTDKFKEVAAWAKETKSEEEVKEFNAELAKAGKLAQQALLKTLYSEYDSASDSEEEILHTNTSQKISNKGYSTQEEFFKDIGSEEYKNNPKYRAAVEAKMARSEIF
jgi:hypothetical protein